MDEGKNEKGNVVILRKSTVVWVLCLCAVLAVGTVMGIVKNWQHQKKYQRLTELSAVVQQNYYTDVDSDSLMDGILKGYVAGLDDPYSQYMTAEEYHAYLTSESGEMVGIGVTVQASEEKYLEIQSVNRDSPAEKAKLQVGDKIVSVDGEKVEDLGYNGAVERVRGEENTIVKLELLRGKELLLCEVVREKMDVITAQGKMMDGKIGYIRISEFRENTYAQFAEVYADLTARGAKALVFDLRDNPGGLVTSVEDVLDPLLPEGDIAIATYRNGSYKTLVRSDEVECDLPMAVIVNGNSASAAELFTASLSDFKEATVVGTKTFGKGVMQLTQPLTDGGALRLTVATYQTTRGECYHKVGITPDMVVEAEEYTPDYGHPNPEEDLQLRAALEAVQ